MKEKMKEKIENIVLLHHYLYLMNINMYLNKKNLYSLE